jgi:general secretion pathway protein M
MMLSLKPWQGRALALALLFIVVLAAYLVLARPLLALHHGYEEAIDQAEDRLQHYNNIIAHRDALKQRLEVIQRRRAAQDFYLEHNSPTLAAAELQEHVKRVVADSQGTLLSTQILPEKAEGQLVKVTVKVAMRGSTETLQKVFHTLEGGRPLLFLDEVFIRAYSLRRGRQTSVSEMEIRFDLSGYLRTGAA